MSRSSRLGVKTVISVDGAKPDVDLAKKHGMRYVHLPHGYDGVPDDRAKELAKAVRRPGRPDLHPLPSWQAPQSRRGGRGLRWRGSDSARPMRLPF